VKERYRQQEVLFPGLIEQDVGQDERCDVFLCLGVDYPDLPARSDQFRDLVQDYIRVLSGVVETPVAVFFIKTSSAIFSLCGAANNCSSNQISAGFISVSNHFQGIISFAMQHFALTKLDWLLK